MYNNFTFIRSQKATNTDLGLIQTTPHQSKLEQTLDSFNLQEDMYLDKLIIKAVKQRDSYWFLFLFITIDEFTQVRVCVRACVCMWNGWMEGFYVLYFRTSEGLIGQPGTILKVMCTCGTG